MGGRTGVQPRVTVNHRILVHLLEYVRAADRPEAPPEVTQQGIAGILRVRRSHVTLALNTLTQRGLVEYRTARIAGGTRRKKAYALTCLGYERARETRAWLASRVPMAEAARVPAEAPAELRPVSALSDP